MKERIANVAEAYAIWNVPHFVPIEDFADFTLLRHAVVFYDPPWVLYEKNFSSVGHQGRRKCELRALWGGNLEKDLLRLAMPC
jgi:hypothetical protein